MNKRLGLFLAMLGLAGCTSGPAFTEVGDRLIAAEPESVKLVVLRTREHLLFGGRPAPIYVDDAEVFEVSRGEFASVKLANIPLSLSTHVWDTPGQCRLPLKLTPAKTYFFEIVPRNSGYFETVLFNMKWAAKAVASGTPPVDLLFVEHASVDCKGIFALVPLNETQALEKLQALTQSL